MVPSVKTMIRHGFTEEQATHIRRLMRRFVERHGRKLRPVRPTRTLGLINEVLEGYGVENIEEHDLLYVNLGDTYDTTVLWVNGRFRIGSWGAVLERAG